MATIKKLKPPENLQINFAPSAKQYKVWKQLQPECPECGGEIVMVHDGYDDRGNESKKPVCESCGLEDIPKLVLAGGSAGGGKSYLGGTWLVSSCARFPGIRAAVARKTLKALKASTVNTILTIMHDEWNMEEGINYNYNKVEGEITFWNGSKIILVELATLPSDPEFDRFGSTEITIGFCDEVAEVDEKAVYTLFSRCRWKTHETFKVSKMLLSTNPTLGWVRDNFVQDEDGQKVVCKKHERYIPFSVFDNPDAGFRATYEASLRMMPEDQKQRLLYGNWDFIGSNEAAFYNGFDGNKHLISGLREKVYDPNKPLILSFDFNVHPFMTCLVAQIDYEKKKIYFLEEILGYPKDKRNNTPALSKYIFNKYRGKTHKDSLVITGDPAGLARSSQTDEGVNNFSIIRSELTGLNTQQKLLRTQPPQSLRGEWINEVFANNVDGWIVEIDLRCRRLTEDLIYQLGNEDGTKDKSKIKDPKTGVKYEKHGHCSDAFDYTMCLFLQKSWYKYKRGGNEATAPKTATVQPTFSY